jgi:general secretion pathway protein B
MSYILDALKRAERERKQGQAPTAFDDMANTTVTEAAHSPLRRRLLFALLFVIAAALGAGAVLLLRGPVTPVPAESKTPAVAATPPPTISPEAHSSGEADQLSAHAAEDANADATAKIADDAHIASLDDLTGEADKPEATDRAASAARSTAVPSPIPQPSPASKAVANGAAHPASDENRMLSGSSDPHGPATGEPAVAHDAGDGTAAPSPAMAAAAPTQTAATDAPDLVGDEPPPAAVAMPKPRRQTPHSAGPGIATPGIDAIKKLKEMPPAYRAEFPPITIDVLAYTDDPARSFVILGGKRYKAGDNIAEGPHLADIVPEGIIFDWRGERVLVSLPH